MDHPYKSAPSRAFWKRAVSEGWRLEDVAMSAAPLLRRPEKIASAGSCFAANIVPYLERAGLTYFKAREPIAEFGKMNEDNFSYSKFSAGYGNIYTTRQALQLVQRVQGKFQPSEDRWAQGGVVIDPFRPGLRFPAGSDAEFDILTAQYLSDVKTVLEEADVFIFTLGLTEAWVSAVDGAVFPACPGTIRGIFDPERHSFHNFTIDEVREDLFAFIEAVRTFNPAMRFILTVSPVPLVATMTSGHVLTATTYSKSVLRVAAEEAAMRMPDVVYFPAYEIVTGPQAPYEFFENDRREPSDVAIRAVMSAFLSQCEGEEIQLDLHDGAPITPKVVAPIVQASEPRASAEIEQVSISSILANAECEEAAAGL
ncbi:GSCFA domain-containing protein [Xanthobacter sp. DSM 24535]|uniref:GSCFA domain-containing protein n=1 Tax=Roseixanthobacter psychrophilus TaxID=3119917 RepID=UPI00372976CF